MFSANQKIESYHMTAREFRGSPFIVEEVAVCNSLKFLVKMCRFGFYLTCKFSFKKFLLLRFSLKF